MEPGRSPLGSWAGPEERLDVGAGLVRNKQAAAPIQKSRSGPAAGAQGLQRCDCPATPQEVGWSEDDRVPQTAPGTHPSVPEQSDRKGAVGTVLSGSLEGG